MPLALIHKALAAIFLVALSLPWARAEGSTPRAVPALTDTVIDQTGTLTAADKAALQGQLQTLERTQGAQMVVLMVPTTAPEDIAAFANRVGNAWKIGRRDVGDGVLVIVAKDDRKMRIEVAKALEGAIPDIAAARIIDEAMKPRFRQGDFAGGLSAAISQLSARIAGESLPAPSPPGPQHGADGEGGFDWTDLAVFLFFGVIVAGPVARSLLGAGLGGLLMGGGVGFVAFAVTSSLLVGAGAGLLALLYTWVIASPASSSGYHPSGGGSSSGSGWGSTGGSWGGGGGGGFSSGGGGDFGGGGASGDW